MEKAKSSVLAAFSKVDPFKMSEKAPAKLYNLGIQDSINFFHS